MRRDAAVAQAQLVAKRRGCFMYVVKDGLAPDDQYEVSTESDLDSYHLGASVVIEVDASGIVPESA